MPCLLPGKVSAGLRLLSALGWCGERDPGFIRLALHPQQVRWLDGPEATSPHSPSCWRQSLCANALIDGGPSKTEAARESSEVLDIAFKT